MCKLLTSILRKKYSDVFFFQIRELLSWILIFLASTMGKFKPSVIALQEIWNKPANLLFDLTDYHPLHFTVRDKQGLNSNAGGGVGLWV